MTDHSDLKRCDLCDQSRFEQISDRDRHGRPLATDVCTHCGLVSHQRIPSEAELAQFYAEDYRRQYHGEITPSSRRVMRAWKHANRIYRQIAPWIAPGCSVFEVGAGVGCNVKVFERHGHPASGIEPNEGFQAYSERKLRAAVTRQYLCDVSCGQTYDLVLLVHVIEHFRSPREALERLHRLTNPGGLLYVETPNLGAVAIRSRQFHVAHVHNFTPLTLATMANRCGFEVVQWYVPLHAPNLQVLMRRMAQPRWHIPPDAHQQTLAAINRFGFWSYHLRWEYLAPRSLDLLSRSWEWVAAPAYVRKVVRSCNASILDVGAKGDRYACRS